MKAKYNKTMSQADGYLVTLVEGDSVLDVASTAVRECKKNVQDRVKGFNHDFLMLSAATIQKKYVQKDELCNLLSQFTQLLPPFLEALEAANNKFAQHLAVHASH